MNQTTSKLEVTLAKEIVFLLLILLWPTLSFCQYEGGSGRQEALSSTTVLHLNNGQAAATSQLVVVQQPHPMLELSQQFILKLEYRTASGHLAYFETGNVSLTFQTNPSGATLGGTTTLAATAGVVEFSGLSVDKTGTGYELLASGASSTSAISNSFTVFSVGIGGSGRQEAMADGPATGTLSGQVFWVGGLGATPTAWNDPLNWYPNTAVPGSSDRLAMEPNNNGHNPILDQNRTIYSMNFNGADKKLELGNHTLTLTADATGVNSSNYFKTNGSGKLKRPSIPNNEGFTFPVGNSAYNPINITNRTGTAEWFSVRVMDEIYEYGTWGNVSTEPRVKRTWDIDKQTPSASAGNGVDFTFNWNANEVSSPAPQNYTLFHHDANGNGWGQVVTGTRDPNFNPAANSMIWTGYKGSFSPFGVGDQNAPLPVELLYFNGTCQPQGLDFRWATAAEVNSKSFTLEHSANLVEWQALHTQPAAGFSSSQKDYSVQLPHQAHLGPYFRLHQEDFDGKFERFAPLHLECSETTNSGLRIFPNPARDAVWVSGIAGTLDWEIFDARGRLLRSGQLNMDMEAQQLPTHGLPAGLYLFQTPNARLPLMLQD